MFAATGKNQGWRRKRAPHFMTHAIDSIVSIQPPFNMIVLITLIAATVGAVAAAAQQIRHWACHRQELALKRELIEHGLSADEIVKVIEASGLDDSTPNWGEIMGDSQAQAARAASSIAPAGAPNAGLATGGAVC
jgi:hypothetical protein